MLEIQEKIFRKFGIIRTEKKNSLFLGISIYCLFSLLIILLFLEFFHVEISNLEKLSEVFEVLFLLVAVNVKVIITYWQHDTISLMISFVDEHQHKLAQNYKQLIRNTTKNFAILVLITACFYSLKSFTPLFQNSTQINITQILIYPTWLPFRTNTFTHSLILIWQFSVALYAAVLLFTWDTFVSSLMVFIVGQLRYVSLGVKNLDKDDDFHQQKLIGYIRHHQGVIRFSRMLNAYINPVMSVYLFTCSVMICSTGFQLFKLGFSMKSFFLLEYIIALMCQLFLFYWFANEIYLESLNLHYATWNSNWYMFSKEQKQMLYILRMFWIKAEHYYVGPFNQMSLKTFLDILQASYTYLTVLKHISDKQDRLDN